MAQDTTTGPPALTLYFREGCHLCEDMELQLAELLDEGSYHLNKIDIDSSAALKEAYNIRVPVLECEKTEVCEHFLDLESLNNALARARARYNGGLSDAIEL